MTPESQDLSPLAEEATSLLKTLGHPARLMICCQLRGGEMSVGEIEAALGIRQPRLSRELAKLREEGFVETRRASKMIYYSLGTRPRVRDMIDAICDVMLDKRGVAGRVLPGARHGRGGDRSGYGVFARTLQDQ